MSHGGDWARAPAAIVALGRRRFRWGCVTLAAMERIGMRELRNLVPIDDLCLARAREIGCAHQTRTLDSIHLAAAERIPAPSAFLTFDARQRSAATELRLSLLRS